MSITAAKQFFTRPFLTKVLASISRPLSTYLHTPITNARSDGSALSSLPLFSPSKLLSLPHSVLVTQCAGMKVMGKLRKRCKHCFFIMIEERLHVWCDVYPRHKQMQMVQKPRTLLRTTHATQHKLRPW